MSTNLVERIMTRLKEEGLMRSDARLNFAVRLTLNNYVYLVCNNDDWHRVLNNQIYNEYCYNGYSGYFRCVMDVIDYEIKKERGSRHNNSGPGIGWI